MQIKHVTEITEHSLMTHKLLFTANSISWVLHAVRQ